MSKDDIEARIQRDNQAFDDRLRANFLKQQKAKQIRTLFDLSIFGEKFKPVYFKDFKTDIQGSTAQPTMEIILKVGRVFVSQILNDEVVHGIFYGNSGRGKTFLAKIIMCECIKKQKSCLFLNALYLKKFCQNNKLCNEYLEYLSQADLVILDDLGIENTMQITENIKQAQSEWQQILYSILNILQNKNLLITTNLTLDEINQTYNPNLFSRMQTHINNTGDKEISSFKINFFTEELSHDLRIEGC